jgi:dihydrofolate synthase/folylpolyglutamate synthase
MPASITDDYQAALRYLYDRINYERIAQPGRGYKFRLQRIAALMRRLGLTEYLYEHLQDDSQGDIPRQEHAVRPRPRVPLVHIAGTKGKGSTAAMVAAITTAAGLRTGLYTSPHLQRLEERFRIDGEPCSQAELIELVRQSTSPVKVVEAEIGPLSFFDLTTALAMLHFHNSRCDVIVLEVGLGGRLDSTNVVAPWVSAVTSIGLDHQHVLGHTLTEIAGEKAGIIKPGVPVVSGVADPAAAGVVAKVAAEHRSTLFELGTDFDFRATAAIPWGTRIEFHGHRLPLSDQLDVTLPLEGDHQGRNAALAIAMTDILRDQGVPITQAAVTAGLSQLQCRGRIERFQLPEQVTGIVDAAHNRDSIAALCQVLRKRFSDRPIAVVFGTSIDKDAAEMLAALTQVTDQIVLTRFWGNPRARPTAELSGMFPASGTAAAAVIQQPIEACERALRMVNPGGTLVVCGSFFLAAETRDWFVAKQLSQNH